MLGGGLDLALGLPNEDLRGRTSEKALFERPKEKKPDDDVYVDAFGNISETPIPESEYDGVDGWDVGREGATATPVHTSDIPDFDPEHPDELTREQRDEFEALGGWATSAKDPRIVAFWDRIKHEPPGRGRSTLRETAAARLGGVATATDDDDDPYAAEAASLARQIEALRARATGTRVPRTKAGTQAVTNRLLQATITRLEGKLGALRSDSEKWKSKRADEAKEKGAKVERTRAFSRVLDVLRSGGEVSPEDVAALTPADLASAEGIVARETAHKETLADRATKARLQAEEEEGLQAHYSALARSMWERFPEADRPPLRLTATATTWRPATEEERAQGIERVKVPGKPLPSKALKDQADRLAAALTDRNRREFAREMASRREAASKAAAEAREGRTDARAEAARIASDRRYIEGARERAFKTLLQVRQRSAAERARDAAAWGRSSAAELRAFDAIETDAADHLEAVEAELAALDAEVRAGSAAAASPDEDAAFRASLPPEKRAAWDALTPAQKAEARRRLGK
jgi:hypothetical protein